MASHSVQRTGSPFGRWSGCCRIPFHLCRSVGLFVKTRGISAVDAQTAHNWFQRYGVLQYFNTSVSVEFEMSKKSADHPEVGFEKRGRFPVGRIAHVSWESEQLRPSFDFPLIESNGAFNLKSIE
jgi:hypothetical protein